MPDELARKWLKDKAPPKRNTSHIVEIDCFPYGLTSESEETSLDLLSDARPYGMLIIGSVLLFLLCCILAWLLFTILDHSPLKDFAVAITAGVVLVGAFLISLFGHYYDRNGPPEGRLSLYRLIERANIRAKRILAVPEGLKFIGKRALRTGSKERAATDAYYTIPWKSLHSVTLQGKSDDFNKLKLRFSGSSESFDLNLFSIHTKENWFALSSAIRHFAPHVDIDDAIAGALTLNSTNVSYTEIWLESLSKPPEEDCLKPIQPGDSFQNGRYIVRRNLGAGGQGHAYSATDTTYNTTVALKEYLLPVYASNQIKHAALAEVEREINLLKKISHPQIVKLLDSFVEKNRAFLVFNQIAGINLKQYIEKNGPMPADQVSALAMQMCDILNYLHSCKPPIVHRDFTPDNLVMDQGKMLTLVDFTIAEPGGSETGKPPSGKPAYMPPEQYCGESSPQSDIYSLGGTLYLLLTGCEPEPLRQLDLPVSALVSSINEPSGPPISRSEPPISRSGPPISRSGPPIARIAPPLEERSGQAAASTSWHAPLAQIISDCTNQNPEARFNSIEEIADILRRHG